jgi:hypoxia up-regulated 1
MMLLISNPLPVAVNFAMSRTFPEEEHHIIYDGGSSGIRATLISFKTIQEPVSKKSKKTNDVTHITVKGFGYDVLASGSEMDLRIRNLLKEKFESKHGRSLEKESKAITKLWKEASRVKTILSANSDSRVSVSMTLGT